MKRKLFLALFLSLSFGASAAEKTQDLDGAKFGDDWDYDFVLFKPVVISSGDVKSLLFNGLGSKYGDSADIGIFNSSYPISVFEYIKANKIKLVVTSHDRKTTKWPITIEEPKKS